MDPEKKNEIPEEEVVDLPIQKSKTAIKFIRYLLLLVMVMVALIFLFANRDQINADNFRRLMAKISMGFSSPGADDGEIHFDTASSGETVIYKDGFAHATVEKLIVTDKNGREFQNTQLGFRKPILTANNRYVFVYDSGGTGLMVADSFSVLFETNLPDPIISAKMNRDGSIAVVTESEGYLAKVYVYDTSFKEVYRYRSLNRYILDAAVSADNKGLVVSAMNIDGANIVPEIMYFTLNKEAVQWTVPFKDDACVDITVKDDGTICGLFSWGMVSLNSDGKELGRYELNNRTLQCYTLTDSEYNIFIVSATENGNGTVVICDEKGAVQDSIILDYYAVAMDYNGNIAVLGNRKAAVYDHSGKVLWEDQPERVTDIALMDKSAVVVVSDTKCVYNSI